MYVCKRRQHAGTRAGLRLSASMLPRLPALSRSEVRWAAQGRLEAFAETLARLTALQHARQYPALLALLSQAAFLIPRVGPLASDEALIATRALLATWAARVLEALADFSGAANALRPALSEPARVALARCPTGISAFSALPPDSDLKLASARVRELPAWRRALDSYSLTLRGVFLQTAHRYPEALWSYQLAHGAWPLNATAWLNAALLTRARGRWVWLCAGSPASVSVCLCVCVSAKARCARPSRCSKTCWSSVRRRSRSLRRSGR